MFATQEDLLKIQKQNISQAVEIFISVRPYQTRVACVEKNQLKQIYFYRNQSPSRVGAIYKGKVIRINRSLNFAFVDLGLERSGFLYGKDLAGPNKEISRSLRKGQKILVQIKADPIRKKGVRLTQEISLPGLFLVYIPQQRQRISVSRQIQDPDERIRLNEIVKKLDLKGSLIVRTLSHGQSEKNLTKEFKQLKESWIQLQEKFKNQRGLGQIQAGEEPLLSCLRDLLSFFIERLLVDEKETAKRITQFLKGVSLDLAKKVEFFKSSASLFESFQLESQVDRAQQKKVSLKNGGFLIFEELEAFTVIDVNSGRFKGERNLADSILQLNLEAARKIADQIQLRHLGGIILVDFVDMEKPEDGEKVVSCLEKGLQRDKSYPKVFKMGELGMVQITRKRSANSLTHFMTEFCQNCQGSGRKKTIPTLVTDLFLKLERMAPKGLKSFLGKKTIRVLCHPDIKAYIEKKEQESLDFFRKKLSMALVLESDKNINLENFRIEKL